MTHSAGETPVPIVSIPDIRDYERINAELAQRLDDGHVRVRLAGAEGQRLLLSGLTGGWRAVVEVEGRAGPELAAGLNAPELTVVCRGPAAEGAGRTLRAGTLLILGDAGPAVGYALAGGAILVTGNAASRAGLNQRGGVIAVLGTVGPLAGERQSGGSFFATEDGIGPHAGRGARGGQFVRLGSGADRMARINQQDADAFRALLAACASWLGPAGPAAV